MIDRHIKAAVLGLALGVSLSLIGFADWGEVHEMLSLTDLRMILTFAGAIAILVVPLRLMSVARNPPHKPIGPGTVIGGGLFGIGWAITGACPSIGLVQLGEGKLAALATCAGILAGVWLHGVVNRRLQWDAGACGS